MTARAPYGCWRSVITSDLIARGATRLGDLVAARTGIYLSESRPLEGGRSTLIRIAADGSELELTPAPFNVRTRVHEYGGGAFTVSGDTVYFSNFSDGRLYRLTAGSDPIAVTAALQWRYAAPQVDETRNRIVMLVEEPRTGSEPTNRIASLSLNGSPEWISVAQGADFYASPRLSPDRSKLCWLEWRHPNMPWDGTELWVANLDPTGRVQDKQKLAGGDRESIFQPEWAADGTLLYISDRTGFWNLYANDATGDRALYPMAADFGLPQWAFEMSTYAPLEDGRILCTFFQNGRWRLAFLDPGGELRCVDAPYTEYADVRACGPLAVVSAAAPTTERCIARVDLQTDKLRVVRTLTTLDIDPGYISRPEHIEFPTPDGKRAYAYFYRPANPDFVGEAAEKPPLLVRSHGGPTAAASSALALRTQYFTSRGFAVLDVNYRGSTGYGRAYREALYGQWGIVDVQDCIAGAQHVGRQGHADVDRMAISGGSAGGYTTLAALTFHDVFKAGASHYGIGDLEALARDTHKFESRYLERLIGPYPEARATYQARSPIHHTQRLSCPVIFFQGLEDPVVPPNQAEAMVAALEKKGIPVAYVPFAGEQHGFRRAENIRRALDGELYFYSQIFGFELPETIEPVEIRSGGRPAR